MAVFNFSKSSTGLKKAIKRIAYDLTHLEVNTIIQADITGGKMPDSRHALINISRTYHTKLATFDKSLLKNQDYIQLKEGAKEGSIAYFDWIRERAKWLQDPDNAMQLEKKTGVKITESDVSILNRIKDSSDLVKNIFYSLRKRHPNDKIRHDNNFTHMEIEQKKDEKKFELPLNTNETVTLRKIWELGTEEIAAQTVIQLDGDVVTRIQPKYATAEFKELHQIHSQSVGTSIKFWKELVHLVKTFFEVIINKLFKKKS